MAISFQIARRIAEAACQSLFKKETDAEDLIEAELMRRSWEALFPKAERDAALKLPKRWQRIDICLRLNVAGLSITLNHPKGFPVPPETSYGCKRWTLPAGDLNQEIRDFVGMREAAKAKRKTTLSTLISTIQASKSMKHLSATWPEGRPFLPQDAVPSKEIAIPFADLNKLIGLSAA